MAYIGAIPVAGGRRSDHLCRHWASPWPGPCSVRCAAASRSILYLALGAIGLPVFAEHSAGLGVFTSVSFGYLISFPIAAALIGYLVKYVVGARRTSALWVFLAIAAGSILVIHPMGITGMKLHQGVAVGHRDLLGPALLAGGPGEDDDCGHRGR